LPADIVVTKAFEVHEDFNAIGSCVKKEYTYQIYNSRVKDPFLVNRAWFYPKHLDEKIMQAAASQFVGTHDFAGFKASGSETETTTRTIYSAKLKKENQYLNFYVTGNGFLYKMVRNIVGTMLKVGEGKLTLKELKQNLFTTFKAINTAKPEFLYMMNVDY
jgi:tRNA pseudouridine38-40 synthase